MNSILSVIKMLLDALGRIEIIKWASWEFNKSIQSKNNREIRMEKKMNKASRHKEQYEKSNVYVIGVPEDRRESKSSDQNFPKSGER